jgi:hypothetical protein
MELWSLGILEWEQGRRPITNLICGRLCVAAKGMINNHGGGDRRKADKGIVLEHRWRHSPGLRTSLMAANRTSVEAIVGTLNRGIQIKGNATRNVP